MTDPRAVAGWRGRDGFKPPPDAGTSYLGKFGIVGNAWAAWILKGDGELLMATSPTAFTERAPICSDGHESRPLPMLYRPGAWKCYDGAHETPRVIEHLVKHPRAPHADVLSRLGDMLDFRWSDEAQEFEIVELDTSV